jgi:hypothetical protein
VRTTPRASRFRTCGGVRFDSGTGAGRRAGGGKKDDARTTAEVYINKLRFRWAYSSRAETTRAR